MKTIHAIYERGVFRPLTEVGLPDNTEVEFVPEIMVRPRPTPEDMKGIYEVMSRRFNSGECDVAARHNEHQP